MARTVNLVALVRGLWGNAFSISRWYIPGHDGIDLPAAEGTPIRAIASGRVSFSADSRTMTKTAALRSWAWGGGNVVNIDVGDDLTTQYAHLQGRSVRAGEYVTKGQIIGTVGRTGGQPNIPGGQFVGSHLHFGLWNRKTNRMVNPTAFLIAARAGVGGAIPKDFLGGWGDLVKYPTGTIITPAIIEDIIAKLTADGMLGEGIEGAITTDIVRATMTRHIGEPWDKTLQDKLQAEFFADAARAADLGGNKAALDAVTGLIGNLTDPGVWVRLLALIAGAGIVAVGSIGLLRATGAPMPSVGPLYRPGIVNVRPNAP